MPDRILLIDPDPAEKDAQLISLSEAGFDAVGQPAPCGPFN